MFDRYMICEDTVRNLTKSGRVVGFEFGARIAYYRGLGLSMVEDLAVAVDGEKIPRERVHFTVGGRTFSLDEMETEYEARWEFGEVATVSVLKEAGLSPGEHSLELVEQLRVSYMPFPIQGRDAKKVKASA
jgi:Domain of unknown function (DUF6379)